MSNKKKKSKNINNINNKSQAPVAEKKLLTVWGLIWRSLLLLAAPYAYLMLCGLVFDMWLKLYDAVPFIFYSLITFYIVDIGIVIWLIVKFVRQRSGKKG